MRPEFFKLVCDYADVWIATDNQPLVDYSYGGTRMVSPRMDDAAVEELLQELMESESALKNRLINNALASDLLSEYAERLPAGFTGSRVGGARCLIRPTSKEISSILQSSEHPAFQATIEPIFALIGTFLDNHHGIIKLTPDFGHFANLSNILYQFTPHVLGISCEVGGCGGKTSYTSTGVITAIEALGIPADVTTPLTIIGSAGAMGSDMLAYVRQAGFSDIAACDIAYEAGFCPPQPLPIKTLPSEKNMFTDPCLKRGGVVVATTIGNELEHSHWQLIPSNTIFLLAHNLATPRDDAGISLMRHIHAQGVLAIPGQLLTLGGALTSRLEWFWRQSRADIPFDKPLAHAIVREVVSSLLKHILHRADSTGQTPYEAMLSYAQDQLSASAVPAPC